MEVLKTISPQASPSVAHDRPRQTRPSSRASNANFALGVIDSHPILFQTKNHSYRPSSSGGGCEDSEIAGVNPLMRLCNPAHADANPPMMIDMYKSPVTLIVRIFNRSLMPETAVIAPMRTNKMESKEGSFRCFSGKPHLINKRTTTMTQTPTMPHETSQSLIA